MAVQTDMLSYFEDEMIDASIQSGQAGTYVDGEWVPSLAASAPIRIIAPQPVSGKDLEQLPQGEHTKNFRVSWTKETVKTREYLQDGDRVDIDGATYKIFNTNDRRILGAYFKFFIREMRDDN